MPCSRSSPRVRLSAQVELRDRLPDAKTVAPNGGGVDVERKLVREAEARECVEGSERGHLADLLVLHGEHVEANRQVDAGSGVPQVHGQRELGVSARRDIAQAWWGAAGHEPRVRDLVATMAPARV